MRKVLFYILTSLLISPGFAYASSLQDQLSAVAQAESQGKAQESREADIRQAQYERELRNEQSRRAKANALAEKKRQEKAAVNAAERKQRLDMANADKKRDQSYEDELRQLEIQSRKLELERQAARAKRENDFIDQDLKSQAAKTDVIQSEADVNRNLSVGGKELMQSEGKSREKKASSWFN
ncbi:hypothetical protein EYY98_22735 [Obesumbacterium proteus]|nr:hypothetical protein EYY98_22735 [Obesumbacterium proteus]